MDLEFEICKTLCIPVYIKRLCQLTILVVLAMGKVVSGWGVCFRSYSGVVNVYDSQSILNSRSPNPVKAIMNLTTPCTHAVFNCTSEILAISSTYAEKAVKLVSF